MLNKEKKPTKKRKFDLEELEPATNSGPKPKRELQGASKEAKALLKDINLLPEMKNTDIEKLLGAIALGMVNDRFGMAASLDTRLKALAELSKIQEKKKTNEFNLDVQDEKGPDYLDSLLDKLENRRIEGVDDDTSSINE